METTQAGASTPTTEVKTVSVSGILADLANGLTRADIKTKYNLTGKQMVEVFQHSKLKGRKTHNKSTVIVIDDTVDGEDTATVETAAPRTRAARRTGAVGVTGTEGAANTAETHEEQEQAKEPEVEETAGDSVAPQAEAAVETPAVEEIPQKEEDEQSPWSR